MCGGRARAQVPKERTKSKARDRYCLSSFFGCPLEHMRKKNLLSQKREVELFAFVYDYNEKRTIATKPFKFKANFSATRITAMKLVKEIDEENEKLKSQKKKD